MVIVMPEILKAHPMDLGYGKPTSLPPVPMLVHLILQQAVLDAADRIEFRLANESSPAGFQVAVRTAAGETNLPPSPGSLFSKRHNQAAPVDAPILALCAIVHPRRRATAQHR